MMGETETKAQAKERVVILGPRHIVVDGEHWKAIGHLLRALTTLIDEAVRNGYEDWYDLAPPRVYDGHNGAEPDA